MPRIFVVAPSWVGDAILAQPMLQRLRARDPGATISVLAPPWVHGVLRRMPEVDEVILNPFGHGALKVAERRRFARSIPGRFDHAILLPNSFKSALIPYFAGIGLRTGYTGEARFAVLNDRRHLDEKALPLIVERFVALADPPGTPLVRPLPEPRLTVDTAARDATLARLGLTLAKPLAVFCPGAEYGPAKRWPADYFARLARDLARRGFQVWTLGSPKDREIGEAISHGSDGVVRNLCGETNLEEAIDLIASAAIVVSNDSGLMHVAAAVNRPMLALYGSSSPDYTPPLSKRAKVLKLELPCSPCFQRECPLKHFKCMMDLTPDRVMAEIPAAEEP